MARERLKEIIEDIFKKYDVDEMDDNDFYKAIVGVYGKKKNSLEWGDFYQHKSALAEEGILTYSSLYSNSFLIYD